TLVWDKQMFRLYGITPDKFGSVYAAWLEGVHPEDVQRGDEEVQRALRGEQEFDTEFRVRWPDGTIRNIRALALVQRDAAGQPTHMIGTNWDITEHKRAEEALRQSSQEVQKINVELERFLYTASHDLKSPVVTVRTFLGYLEQDLADAQAERVAKDLFFIRAAADKMVQLLDDLLEFSRIGRVLNPPVSVTLRDLADETLRVVAGRIAERGVTVQVGDHDVTLYGDRLRLAEIWQNLVENAAKFMGGQPEPRVEIGVETRGAETVFFVRDNGIGIDPRFQEKLFGLFEKLDPKAEGTGLGLALVKRIVELYQGRIWVESPGPGQGACFYFTLPRAINKEPKEGEEA
ncbi:MAG: ATP-binding protein, partial [Planctomycetota bacterium]|nr:ATP-binding protein [Planctomycetota bacterium]